MSEVLRFDITKEPKGNPITYGRVGDSKGLTRKVKIFEDGKPFDLTGWTITFEGNTSKYKTKVFDSDGISSIDEKTGEFNYTFPNMAFAVEGQYERAYFSFIKDDLRKSTGNFEIIVFDNSDIDVPEAETIITEYNKLVAELRELQDQAISELNQRFTDTNIKIAALEIKLNNTEIQINQALKEFNNGDFYTRTESDELFAKPADITKENVGLGNVDDYSTATQAEAESGAAIDKFMTVQRTKQQIDKRLATDSEVVTATNENKLVTPKNLKTYYDDRQKIAVARYGLSDVTTASKLSDASWRYRRIGNEVEFFGRFNFSAATDVFTVHTLPIGFRLSADFDDTSWNVPLVVSKVANPTSFLAVGFVERIGTNLLRIACNAGGNTYWYGRWYTDDPFQIG